MFKSFINLSKSERQREKQKDYQNVVLLQIVIMVIGLTLSDFLLEGQTTGGKLVTTICLSFSGIYSFLLWDLLRNFTDNKILIKVFLIILLGIVVVGSLVEFPYYKLITVPNRQYFLLTLHILLFIIEVTIIGYAIRDVFSGEFLTSDKLWGAACVFLMTGLSFSSLFHLICLVKLDSLGEIVEMGLANYAECVSYSLSIMGGIDPGHPNASHLIKNISVLEALWSSLFAMLIIGKLMGLPRPPKAGEN